MDLDFYGHPRKRNKVAFGPFGNVQAGKNVMPLFRYSPQHLKALKILNGDVNEIIRDTVGEADSWDFGETTAVRSWLGIRMFAAGEVLGLLSLGHSQPHALPEVHLRLARSLAIPAAAAIENARLYERAQMYGEELRNRLANT